MSDTNVITLFPRGDAPVQRFPDTPPPFGQRKPGWNAQDLREPPVGFFRNLDAALGMRAAREADDRAEQLALKSNARIERAARAAAEADGRHVCASLKRDLAAKITGAAMLLETLAEEAKACGLTSTLIALREHAGLLEKESALVACALPDGDGAA